MSNLPAVSLTDVSFAYRDTAVFDHAQLTIEEGDFATVVGPNGGGKTTLLRLILGLLSPLSGQVRIYGQPPARARSRVGYLAQHAHLDPQFPVSARDVVLMGRVGRRLGGRHTRKDQQAAHEALAEVDMTALADRPFSELSGGQRQRILIARALCSGPDMLLLDEPTANVDSTAEERLFQLLSDLNRRMTILMVSHDLGVVSRVVRTVVCVNHRIVVHPTSDLTGKHIQDIYDAELSFVRHDHPEPSHG